MNSVRYKWLWLQSSILQSNKGAKLTISMWTGKLTLCVNKHWNILLGECGTLTRGIREVQSILQINKSYLLHLTFEPLNHGIFWSICRWIPVSSYAEEIPNCYDLEGNKDTMRHLIIWLVQKLQLFLTISTEEMENVLDQLTLSNRPQL